VLEGSATHKGIELLNQVSAPLMAYGDANMLETVIRNLLSNALKFTHSGGQVSVAVRAEHGWLEVAVSDTGVGMDEETRQKLFRLDATHSTRGTAQERGTGLGLLLCHDMVVQHGGRIWVESIPGEGSTFTFTIPQSAELVTHATNRQE
nr:ATP-binding protein [Ardenticatenales bacterium]